MLFGIGPNAGREMLFVLALANVALATVARRRYRWAIVGTVVVAALVALRWTPMVAYNWWMFFQGHKLYSDSPGTIIIVAQYSLLFALPALGVLVGYLVHGRAFLSLFAQPSLMNATRRLPTVPTRTDDAGRAVAKTPAA